MPMVDLTLPRGALDPAATTALLDKLGRLVLKWEGAPEGNANAAAVLWAYAHEAEVMTVGGRAPDRPRYRVEVTVPVGALSDRRKAGLVAEVTDAVLKADGAPADEANRLRVWCVVREVPDGNWGAGGRVWRLADVRDYVLGG